jgi:hypothetical protein
MALLILLGNDWFSWFPIFFSLFKELLRKEKKHQNGVFLFINEIQSLKKPFYGIPCTKMTKGFTSTTGMAEVPTAWSYAEAKNRGRRHMLKKIHMYIQVMFMYFKRNFKFSPAFRGE